MQPPSAILTEVEPVYGDTYETVALRYCDICFESVVCDPEWRTMYHDATEGLYVCEHCLEAYLRNPE